MQLVRGLSHLALPVNSGCVATIGNFDGVHRGHQALLQQLRQQALALGLPTVVITFEPQPREFFDLAQAPARLTNLREKYVALAALGIDYLVCLNFNPRLAQLTAAQFIEQLLVQGLGVRYLVVGDDFRFGAKRQGDFSLLQTAGQTHGFDVVSMATFAQDALRVSSSRVREALQQGALATAMQLLGRPYSMTGRVMHGAKLGRQLGFATANIALRRRVLPLHGVFAVQVSGGGLQQALGVANIGWRPTVDGRRAALEVHVLDLSPQLYGEVLQVTFLHKLRDEMKFVDVAELKAAIGRDLAAAREFFAGQAGAAGVALQPADSNN